MTAAPIEIRSVVDWRKAGEVDPHFRRRSTTTLTPSNMKVQERAHRVGTTARTQALTGKTNGIRTRRLPNGVIGNVGLFYVCYQLSRMGWNVMPTARNAKGVDLIAYSDDASRVLSLQVKALSKRAPVPHRNGARSILRLVRGRMSPRADRHA